MQMRKPLCILAVAALAAACGDPTAANDRALLARTNLAAAFATVPVGYTSSQTTYNSSGEGIGPMFPGMPAFGLGPGQHGERGGMGGMGDMDMGGGMGPLMGGGLGDNFTGGMGLGRDFGRGRQGDPDVAQSTCTYDANAKRATCAPVTDHGLTITRSVAWYDAAGNAQAAFDTVTTDAINTKVTVAGTMTRRDSAVSTNNNASDRTVAGLAKGSTKHTINGTASGNESTTGKDSAGTFTATRVAADTVKGVVVPVLDTGRTYPTAGTIIRVMTVSVVRSGGTASSTRREVVTYDGTDTAKIVITTNGTTQNCTRPLPRGRLSCS